MSDDGLSPIERVILRMIKRGMVSKRALMESYGSAVLTQLSERGWIRLNQIVSLTFKGMAWVIANPSKLEVSQ